MTLPHTANNQPESPFHRLKRRSVAIALVAAPTLWLGARALPSQQRQPTPAQTEGPFYPVDLPKDSDFDLLRNGALQYNQGQPAWLEGVVTDLAGKPVRGAQVEIWQCDHAGHYHHPGDGSQADVRFQGFGRVVSDSDGSYRFRTIRPASYPGRTPHIHVKVRLGARELLTTQVYVADEPQNKGDFLWRTLRDDDRTALTVPFKPGTDGLRAHFPIVLKA